MRLLYTIGIGLYTFGVRLAALFGHGKARLMVRGWRSFRRPAAAGNHVWFHASSLGEFEQARPVLEEYRRRHPDCRVLLTFFSPSGYEVRKNYDGADTVLYLPPDLPGTVRRFLDTWQPTAAFFVKYDFWYNYLGELHRRGIPTYIFSAIFRPGQYFFRPWGRWYLHQIGRCYNHIFVQNDESQQLLRSHDISRCSMAGDTRFDRVHQIAQVAESNAVAETFLEGYEGKVLVAGSTWPPDEKVIAHVRETNEDWFPGRIILAPHVISEEHLRQIEALFPDSIRYSKLNTEHSTLNTKKVLIVDNIGLLSKLYRYADVAYIGGGFGSGIHNILEAVTFGKPVFFGPIYQKFQEAHDIIARGGGWSIRGEYDMEEGDFMRLMTHPEALGKASQECLDYMQQNLDSTEKILSTIES